MADRKVKVQRSVLYPGTTKELNDLSKGIENALLGVDEQVTVLNTRLLYGVEVNANSTVNKRIGSYYVDLRKNAVRMTLPSDPYIGETHRFKDKYGVAATYNLVLYSSTKQIEQSATPGTWASTLTVNLNGACVMLEYDGDYWSIV